MSAKPVRHGKKWRIRWKDHAGKRLSTVYPTYKIAVQALRHREIETEEILLGLRKPEKEVRTFNDAADYWEKHRSSRKKRPEDDKYILSAHLRHAFGDLPLGEITTEKVDIFVSKLDRAPATVRNILTLLISILRLACDNQWIDRVPKIKKPKIHLLSKEFNYLHSLEEGNQLLTAARAVAQHGERIFMMYLIAIFTGLRAGELAGLRWTDVDFQRRMITVQRSYEQTTKSGRVRYIPILDQLLPALRDWRLKNPHKWVVPNATGGMHKSSDRIFQETLHNCLTGAGLPRLRFHDLRHSFATLWMKSGGDIFRLQKILGHQNIQMTLRYAHFSPDYFADDFSRLGQSLPVTQGEVVDIEKFKQVKGEF